MGLQPRVGSSQPTVPERPAGEARGAPRRARGPELVAGRPVGCLDLHIPGQGGSQAADLLGVEVQGLPGDSRWDICGFHLQ